MIDTHPELVFIVGHPRSGSTLLTTRLGQHPLIHAMPETHFFSLSINGNVFQKLRAYRSPEAFIGFLRKRNHRLADLAIGDDAITAALQKAFPRFDAAFSELTRQESAFSGCPIILEKTPIHLYYIDQITSWYPDAKIIVILRDGRDAIESLMAVNWINSKPVRLAALWARSIRLAKRARRRWPDRVKLLRYEDFVENPEKELRSICTWLGIELEPEMLSRTHKNTAIPAWELGWKEKSGQAIDKSLIQKWRHSAEPELVAAAEELIAEQLEEMGYQLSQPRRRASLNRRIHFTLEWFRQWVAYLRLRYLDTGLYRKRASRRRD